MNRQKQRYLIRVETMARMAADDTIGGQQQVAEERFVKELQRFAEFGFSSMEAVLAAIASDSNEVAYSVDSMGETYIGIPKGSANWKKLLCYACGLQLNCFPVMTNLGGVKVYGPEELRSQVLWVYETWLDDIESGARRAWNEMSSIEQAHTTKRKFTHAYCGEVIAILCEKEQERYQEARNQERSQGYHHREGLTVVNRSGLISACESYAVAQTGGFRTSSTRSRSSSTQGRAAGVRDSGRYSNRRVTSGQKRLT